MILFAMNTLQILEGENVIKVGDSVIDIEEGKNANCKFSIGITTGAHTKDQLAAAKPSYIIDNIYDIKNIILNA
jgi:phosphoglycolate phosphatase-like HAD superfamily hydrolase